MKKHDPKLSMLRNVPISTCDEDSFNMNVPELPQQKPLVFFVLEDTVLAVVISTLLTYASNKQLCLLAGFALVKG
jgi:hypothetical protein